MRVGPGGQRLLAAAPRRQQLSLLRVPPFHPAVLKPDLHLQRTKTREQQRDGDGAGLGDGRYLRVLQAQFTGQLLPIGFADIFLLLEGSLQGLPLQV